MQLIQSQELPLVLDLYPNDDDERSDKGTCAPGDINIRHISNAQNARGYDSVQRFAIGGKKPVVKDTAYVSREATIDIDHQSTVIKFLRFHQSTVGAGPCGLF